jgi:DNA-binding protein HU-beta
MADRQAFSKKELEKAVNAFCSSVSEALPEEARSGVGFGTFATKIRAARKVYNPTNKAKTKAKARTIPVFKAGKNLKSCGR